MAKGKPGLVGLVRGAALVDSDINLEREQTLPRQVEFEQRESEPPLPNQIRRAAKARDE